MDKRTKIIEALIDNDIRDIQQELNDENNHILYTILRYGWKGYADLTDKELEHELEDREMTV